MKPMNPLMTTWSNWKLRPPAPGLKARIFAAQPAAREDKLCWDLLAPVMACLMVTLVVMNSGNSQAPARLAQIRMTNLILSNQNYSAYATGGSQEPQNRLDSLTFDRTNRSALTSPTGFTPSTH